MVVEVRSAPTRTGAGKVVNPVANTAREQISANQILDWVLHGYVFSGGSLLVDAGDDTPTVTSKADTTPMLGLRSPSGKDTIVVPLRVTAGFTNDGGADSNIDLVWTKAGSETAERVEFESGTTIGAVNHLTKNPGNDSKCEFEYTITHQALLAADCMIIAHAELVNAGLTTGKIQLGQGFDYVFSVPLALTEGAALLLYGYSGTGAGKIRACMTWAEIPADAYGL